MAPSSSSTKKAAKLAQKGKGKRVRFQGGTLFPLIVAIVLVVGLALIVYARASRPDADASPPQPNLDHWHAAYGLQLCTDEPNVVFSGNLEVRDASGNLIGDSNFINTGVHSHDDGVIHWHAYTTKAAGKRAQLGIFFDNYGMSISNTKLELPEGDNALIYEETGLPVDEDFPREYEEGETQCEGEDAELKVVVWTDYTDPSSSRQYTSDFDEIPFDRDGLVVVVAFVPNDVDVVMPSWAANLPELGAADSGGATSNNTVPPSTVSDTSPDGTVTDDTATPDTATEGTSDVAATEPDDTASDDTTGPATSVVGSSVPSTTD